MNNGNTWTQPGYIPSQSTMPPSNGSYNAEEYAFNILKKNIGKKVKVYASFSDSIEWRDSIFEGIIEETGRDYILLYDNVDNKRYLLWAVYINYLMFEEQLNRKYWNINSILV